jgi:hypothetical protein
VSADLIRHTLATLAYRLGKVLLGTPDSFGEFRASGQVIRTPAQILAHIGDLMDWALAQVEGRKAWNNSTPLPWPQEIARFFAAMKALDDRIAAGGLSAVTPERLFQGAIADALTHTGQIALLRRLAGIPVKGENYAIADISAGRVGSEQSAPRLEFD